MTITTTAQAPDTRIAAQGGYPMAHTTTAPATTDAADAANQTATAKPRRKRNRKPTEELKGMFRRMLRAYVKRAADEDPWVVADLLAIRTDLDSAIDDAVANLVARGYSWNDIGQELGMTRQAAWKRWGK
jgi:hypothetical protein